MTGTLTGWLLGLLLGMRHALEPDHLVAVSTLVTGGKPSKGALIGLVWGLGHSLSLLVVGAIVTLLGAQLPIRLAYIFEFCVAIMLIVLGALALRRARFLGRRGDTSPHAHGQWSHVHAGPRSHVHLGRWTFDTRPLAVGLVHGLAGSGWLTALVVASLPNLPTRLIYIALFGLGSIAGMAALSGLVGWPMERLGRSWRARQIMSTASGLLSIGLGLWWVWPLAYRAFALR